MLRHHHSWTQNVLRIYLVSFRLSYGYRLGRVCFGWNFHGSLHEGGLRRQGTAGHENVVHGKDDVFFPIH